MAHKIIAAILICSHFACMGQIQVDTSKTATQLVEEILLGDGVLVGNIQYTGHKFGLARYQDTKGTMGIKEGLILSSGSVFYASGPNKSPRAGWINNTPGDKDLDKITTGKTYDAAVLEFDFVSSSEKVVFKFVFASEEYLEYVGSKFNDVFGFFVDGPGMPKTNIALLPNRKTPITINNVNHQQNTKYFVDNTFQNTTDPFIWDVRNRKVVKNKMYLQEERPPDFDTQFDGFTVVLEAKCKVIPDEVYHIKMAVADVADAILDSGVLLQGGSFKSQGRKVRIISKRFDKPQSRVLLKPVDVPPLPTSQRATIINVEFAFDRYDLPDTSVQAVRKVHDILSEHPAARVEIAGHTDSHGSDQYNIGLSEKRSYAVASALMLMGTPKERIRMRHHGESSPIKSNTTDEGRARNRRVEFRITYNTP